MSHAGSSKEKRVPTSLYRTMRYIEEVDRPLMDLRNRTKKIQRLKKLIDLRHDHPNNYFYKVALSMYLLFTR